MLKVPTISRGDFDSVAHAWSQRHEDDLMNLELEIYTSLAAELEPVIGTEFTGCGCMLSDTASEKGVWFEAIFDSFQMRVFLPWSSEG